MRISESFQLDEFTRSQYAVRNGIDNSPPDAAISRLKDLVSYVLQPLRDHYGQAVTISSGYRCEALNSAIGGAPSSQHIDGKAADIEIVGIDNLEVATWLATNLPFDQLILEYYVNGSPNSGWIHVSYEHEQNRRQILTKIKGVSGYSVGLPE